MDSYNVEPNAKWRIEIVVETQNGTLFPVPIVVSFYRDRAAFMMDAANILNKNYIDNPRHYMVSQTFSNVSSASIVSDVLNNGIGYLSIHIEDSTVIPASIPLRVYVILKDLYGTYTIANDLDRRDMPWQNVLSLVDQITPNSDIYKFPLTSIYDRSIVQIGYDINGVSNNLLDYTIHGTDATYYDPYNIETFDSVSTSLTGLRYLFEFNSLVSEIPPADLTSNWSLYFQKGSQNLIRDTYSTDNNIYMSSYTTQQPLVYDRNETVQANWFDPNNTSSIRELYLNPVPNGLTSPDYTINYSTIGSLDGIFLACANTQNALITDASTSIAYQDSNGLCGVSFFLNTNDIVKFQNIQLKFAYIQPSLNGVGSNFTRMSSPLGLANTSNCEFLNQATYTSILSNSAETWDDAYYYNRRNTKIGIFNTADISGANIQSLDLNSALTTMTLKKVTQQTKYTNSAGTFRTREPEWGTYYTYEPVGSDESIWDVSEPSSWIINNVPADFSPTYVAGENSYPGYFLTYTNIQNYSHLPRTFGIATAVGFSVDNPNLYVGNYTEDIENSYTIVPFYNDPVDGIWKAGSFYGLCYTETPCLPPPDVVGDTAPYQGPTGIFGWSRNISTISLTYGPHASFKPFYWNAKIDYQVLDEEYDPATDLGAFGGFTGISTEYQDTVMFLYKNSLVDKDIRDISSFNVFTGSNYWQWGIEQNTNYYAWDDQSGYNYLSYINNITVRSSSDTLYDYAIHVRGYVPTSEFNTGIRFIGKNYTDFGSATLQEIANEINNLNGYVYIDNQAAHNYVFDPAGYSTIIHKNDTIRLGSGNFFSHQYADRLVQFNDLFVYPAPKGIAFGKKIGYRGKTFSFSGYADAMNQYVSYYSTLRGTLLSYTNVLSTTTGLLNEYVRERYNTILPEGVLNRTRITDPIPFSLLLKSKLTSPYDNLFDEWGLGWNLGFAKADTPYFTNHTSETFIRITQDYIYLRLNPEMNLNTMGVSAKEDLSLTRDPFGENNKYFAKILLNNFASFCRAAVQMPKLFSPVLARYDTISLELLDRNGNPIDNADCDFDIVMEMEEVTDSAVTKFAVPQGW
jgi:hypothetical protein